MLLTTMEPKRMKENREEKEAWGEVDKLRGEVMMMQREWRVSRGPGREGQPGIPPGLQKLLDKCRELGGGEEEWREELELWRWSVALLKATRADGTIMMASRAWAKLTSGQLPVSPPDWLLERAAGHKVTAKPVNSEQVNKDVEEVMVKEGNSEKPQGDVKEVEVKDVKDEEEEDVKEEVYIEKISEEDSEKPQSEEGKEEEEDVWEEIDIKEEKVNEEDSEKPQSEEDKEKEEDMWEEVDIMEVKVNKEVSGKPQSKDEETPRKRGRCSPGAAARSRRRLLEFQARIEPVLGPSRLQLLQRGLTTPSTPIPRKHQMRATNLQGMFEAAARVEQTASTAGAEEASSTAGAEVAARAEGVPGGGGVVEEERGEEGSSGGSAGYINLH